MQRGWRKNIRFQRVFLDYRDMSEEPEIEMVTITAPNRLHAQMTIDIANAGKHVVCEKPLCMTLAEADEMIDTCKRQGVILGYAEELFFTPKYVKAKEMADQGGFGKVHLVKQSEKHFGPHSAWFWDVAQSGGGALMIWAVKGSRSAIGSLGDRQSRACTHNSGRTCMPKRPEAMTKPSVLSNSKTERSGWSSAVGASVAACSTRRKSMVRAA